MIFIALAVVTLLVGAGACFMQYGNLTDAQARLAKLRAEDKDEKTLHGELEATQAAVETAALKLNHLEQSVSQAEYVPTLLKELENIGRMNGIAVTGVRPIPKPAVTTKKGEAGPTSDRKPYIELDIEVHGRGNYRSVMNFVNALQTFPKIVAARTVSMEPKSVDKNAAAGNLDATIVLRTYVFTPPKATRTDGSEKTASLSKAEETNHG